MVAKSLNKRILKVNDCLTMLQSLRRPSLLIRAARHGQADYRRERDLKRLIPFSRIPGPREAIVRLLEEEATLNETRKQGESHYDVLRHVQVMIALVGEAALIKASKSMRGA